MHRGLDTDFAALGYAGRDAHQRRTDGLTYGHGQPGP
jgi:hypothetical protein